MATPGCAICRGTDGDAELDRVGAWRDAHWRLSMSRRGPTLGFSYLEPIRHIPYLADLDGDEAATFGPAVARASRVLREATGGAARRGDGARAPRHGLSIASHRWRLEPGGRRGSPRSLSGAHTFGL